MPLRRAGTRTAESNRPKAWAQEVLRVLHEEGYGVGESILYNDLASHFAQLTRALYLRAGLAHAIEDGWLLRGKFDDSVSFTQVGFEQW